MQVQGRYPLIVLIGIRTFGCSIAVEWRRKSDLEGLLALGGHGCCPSHEVHKEARYASICIEVGNGGLAWVGGTSSEKEV